MGYLVRTEGIGMGGWGGGNVSQPHRGETINLHKTISFVFRKSQNKLGQSWAKLSTKLAS